MSSAAYVGSRLRMMPGDESVEAFARKDPARFGEALTMFCGKAEVEVADVAGNASQRSLSEKIDKALLARLLRSPQFSKADIARMKALAEPHASAWLNALPNVLPFDNRLTAVEFRVVLQHRLGVPLVATALQGECPACRQTAIDRPGGRPAGSRPRLLDGNGHHALTCLRSSTGDAVIRHNAIQTRFTRMCRTAGFTCLTEQGGIKRRPADLLVRGYFSDGTSAALDFVTIVRSSPLSADPHSFKAGTSATEEGEKQKHKENDGPCEENGWRCIPMAVNTFGGWGKEAVLFIQDLAVAYSTATDVSLWDATNFIYITLEVPLMRHNARAIVLTRHGPPAGAGGEAMRASSLDGRV